MECKDLNKKFEDIGGWTKTNDGREAVTKEFIFNSPLIKNI